MDALSMEEAQAKVLAHHPDARAVEHNYGTGHRKIWRIWAAPWAMDLGSGATEAEAWINAAATIL